MANAQMRSQRLRVSGIAAHVRGSAAEFSCQLEELSADGAFLRADRLVEIGSTLEVELVKPGARKPLRLRGIVLRAIPGRDGQQPGLDVEFRLVPNEDFQGLVAWIDEMRARAGHALSQLPGIAPPAQDSDGEGERSKLMLQIKGLLMEMDDLRDRLRMRDIEIDDLRSQLATAEQLLGRRT
ncbi:MAG TPA: PilZ domain-containing protein [Myxococcales bacterium]|nr:PilZ domain-containing protein [Myxococcales bacterium]